MKAKKRLLALFVLLLVTLLSVTSCGVSTESGWDVHTEQRSTSLVGEAKSSRYSVYAAAMNNLYIHATDDLVVITGTDDNIITILAACNNCYDSEEYHVIPGQEFSESFKCKCGDQNRLRIEVYEVPTSN